MAQILFENGALLDPAAGELRPGSSVLVEADRIVLEGQGKHLAAILRDGELVVSRTDG